MGRKISNRTGQRFGKLVVMSFAGKVVIGQRIRYMWRCDCDCGAKNVIIRHDSLIKHGVKSCGCALAEERQSRSRNITIDGVTMKACQWAKRYGIRTGHIYDRIRNGMTAKQAVETPVGRSGVRLTSPLHKTVTSKPMSGHSMREIDNAAEVLGRLHCSFGKASRIATNLYGQSPEDISRNQIETLVDSLEEIRKGVDVALETLKKAVCTSSGG